MAFSSYEECHSTSRDLITGEKSAIHGLERDVGLAVISQEDTRDLTHRCDYSDYSEQRYVFTLLGHVKTGIGSSSFLTRSCVSNHTPHRRERERETFHHINFPHQSSIHFLPTPPPHPRLRELRIAKKTSLHSIDRMRGSFRQDVIDLVNHSTKIRSMYGMRTGVTVINLHKIARDSGG